MHPDLRKPLHSATMVTSHYAICIKGPFFVFLCSLYCSPWVHLGCHMMVLLLDSRMSSLEIVDHLFLPLRVQLHLQGASSWLCLNHLLLPHFSMGLLVYHSKKAFSANISQELLHHFLQCHHQLWLDKRCGTSCCLPTAHVQDLPPNKPPTKQFLPFHPLYIIIWV